MPAGHRRHILVRSDSAGASHEVLAWQRTRNTPRRRVEYSVGWRIDGDERAAITALPETAWSPAIDADGGVREGAFVTLRGRIAPSPLWTFPMRSPLDYGATVKAAAYPRPAPRSSYTTVGQPGSSGVRGAGQAIGTGKEEVDVVGRSCFELFTDGMGSAWAYATGAPGRVASV